MKELRLYQKQAVQECWNELKETDEPVLLMASVGSGKSLMLASILIRIEKLGKRALCLVNNAELVRNNCAIFKEQGGKTSVYCAALGEKEDNAPIIFGTPQSILNGINKNERIAQIRFNILVVDEAHTINYNNSSSVLMRILRHYKQEYEPMRVLGATGTNFRYKGERIVGSDCLFRKQVGNITTEHLIKDGYLINPEFEIDKSLIIDFSKIKIKNNGKFDSRELELVVNKNTRLTELICKQIVHIMETQHRFGVFIFATTKKHAEEILCHLPTTQSALILGETNQGDRTRILNEARIGNIRYLVNISIISVGVDIPAYDTIAYLRPTESLVLLVQTMGRVLRLSENTGKTQSLVLDFAGNIERHQDWDNPIILKAVNQTINKDKPLLIICPKCQSNNTEHARRCIGSQENGPRCDYYFEFKECPNENCKAKNDIATRHCRVCSTEIIDPNKKLTLDIQKERLRELRVINTKYGLRQTSKGFRVFCMYKCKNNKGAIETFFENYTPTTEKSKNVFYGQFVKKHINNPSNWYKYLDNQRKILEMLSVANNPISIVIKNDSKGLKIQRKIF